VILFFQICAVRQKKKSFVDSIKGQFGFLDYEVEEGKKLFFHISEVQDNATLNPGDSVEFSIVTNQVGFGSFNSLSVFFKSESYFDSVTAKLRLAML
jgi:cold shock CspA family protein